MVRGYLTSWPSGDLVVAGRQNIACDWWPYALNVFVPCTICTPEELLEPEDDV
jgi:hypothetical protein